MSYLIDEVLLPKPEKILKCIKTDESLTLITNLRTYEIYHEQECCEEVWLADVGDLDLEEILNEELIGFDRVVSKGEVSKDEYGTFTFITIRTNKDSYQLRFCGTSNGYYSETAIISVYSHNKENEQEIEHLIEYY